ncbi:MAG: hypothetical protein HXX08_09985 [Chloroflexi bacterium]|uniref:Uncharacterized protein n=1 Tax=Candidatus Chlorohelix allophototropha TaxID=3003348 RepID=A0A8T7LZ00_9CHLR|nr:hypothetical protein [Chloroflexota bacterium]WJW65574.1 hypothetical protein OZ401_001341 [Chloroflexota bacterium L227-S17]
MAVIAPQASGAPAPVKPARTVKKRNRTLRRQILWFLGACAALAVIAFLAVISATTARISTFNEIASIAVPSINATNDATQLLAGEVENTGEYILADQGKATSSAPGASAPATNKQSILAKIEEQRAAFDLALQRGYSALSNYSGSIKPDASKALLYISTRYGRLQDALAQARALTDKGDLTTAIQAFLNGQNDNYEPLFASLYFLRSVHQSRLEEAESSAVYSAELQQYLAVAATIIFGVGLVVTNLWVTFRVKRVFVPLLNLALLIVLIYSIFLWSVLSNSRRDLTQVVATYNRTALLSDSLTYITDASSDQVQWVISGKQLAGQTGLGTGARDEIYNQDLKTRLELLLSLRAKDGTLSVDPTQLVDCPASATSRANYNFEGNIAQLCRELPASYSSNNLNQFIKAYRDWLTMQSRFSPLVTSGKIDEALTLRSGDGAKAYTLMADSLNKERNLNIQDYRNRSQQGTDGLSFATQLAWIIYPAALALVAGGLLVWRREF